jgi:teichuronic acid biosynthesis glycosyltransferase TuaC
VVPAFAGDLSVGAVAVMRSLWVTPGYPWAGNPVGFTFHQSQAQAVAALGVDVSVQAPTPWVPPFVGTWRPHTRIHAQAPRTQQDGAVAITRPRYLTTPREARLGLAHLTQGLSAQTVRPDIIHAHFAYPQGMHALALKRRFGVPLVLTLHGDDVTVYPHSNRRMRRLFVSAVRGADRVLAVSPELAAMTEALTGVRPEALSTGVDLSRFDAVHDRARERTARGILADAFVILYVGGLLAQKGVYDLADAVGRLDWKDAVTLLAGEGPARPPGVRLLGSIPNPDIPRLLAVADVLVLPSWHEGLGQAAVEAGAAGIPLVGARTGGLAGLVAGDRGYGFAPRDVGGLVEALRAVRADRDEARRRAALLREHVRVNHDLNSNAARLVSLYRELAPSTAN